MTYPFLPRLIRLRDAPLYLGMDRNRFNKKVRPGITEIPIGEQGIAFDRLEMDTWVDQYKACNGRPSHTKGVMMKWDKKDRTGEKKECRSIELREMTGSDQ